MSDSENNFFILLIEDNEGDAELIRFLVDDEFLPIKWKVLTDGQAAVEYFDKLNNKAASRIWFCSI